MVWSVNPSLTGAEVKNVIISSVSQENSPIVVDRRSGSRIDMPRVNAYAAVRYAAQAVPSLSGGRLAGRVSTLPIGINQDGIGFPISNARVGLYRWWFQADVHYTYTCEYGFFNFDDVDLLPAVYILRIEADGFVPYFTTMLISYGSNTSLSHLNMIPIGNGYLSGIIARGGNTPEPQSIYNFDNNTPVVLTFYPLQPPPDTPDTPVNVPTPIKTYTTTFGNYHITLPAGIYQVTATAEGFLPTTTYVISYGGHTWEGQDIVLYPDPYWVPPVNAPQPHFDVVVLIDNARTNLNFNQYDMVVNQVVLANMAVSQIHPEYDRVGVQTFGGAFSNEIHLNLGAENANRDNALAVMDTLRTNNALGNTRFTYASLVEAIFQFILNPSPYGLEERVIVVVTIGEDHSHNRPPGGAVSSVNLEFLINFAATHGVTIHTIGFLGNNTANNSLNSIANSTGGLFFGLGGYFFSDLEEKFAQVFDRSNLRSTPRAAAFSQEDTLAQLYDLLSYIIAHYYHFEYCETLPACDPVDEYAKAMMIQELLDILGN